MNNVVVCLVRILMEGKGLFGCGRACRHIASANHAGTSTAFDPAKRSAKHNQNKGSTGPRSTLYHAKYRCSNCLVELVATEVPDRAYKNQRVAQLRGAGAGRSCFPQCKNKSRRA